MYYQITNLIKPTTTRRRDPKGATTTMVSSVKLIARGMTKATILHYCLLRWKTGATVVVAPLTRVPNVPRRIALHVWSGKSIRLPNCKEFSRCSNR